jgi:hypothetical protein
MYKVYRALPVNTPNIDYVSFSGRGIIYLIAQTSHDGNRRLVAPYVPNSTFETAPPIYNARELGKFHTYADALDFLSDTRVDDRVVIETVHLIRWRELLEPMHDFQIMTLFISTGFHKSSVRATRLHAPRSEWNPDTDWPDEE